MANRASHPRVNFNHLGRAVKGLSTRGPQTAATGRETIELGMNRNAITLSRDQKGLTRAKKIIAYKMKNHAQRVWGIHLWRVAGRTVAEIHQPRITNAIATRM